MFLWILLTGLLVSLYLSIKYSHRWSYRNPFSRQCTRCGRSESMWEDGYGMRWEQDGFTPTHSTICGRKK
jgi:hypothetical protein